MSRYDKDIEENQYLSESGKYAAQFARNHNISISEALQHRQVQAYKEVVSVLRGCYEPTNGNKQWKMEARND